MHTIGRTLATVRLGVHKNLENCCASLKTNGINISPRAEDILKKTLLSQIEIDFELREVSVAELDFNKATRFDVICERIVERDFDLCPGEAGPAVRLTYKNQPKGERLIVAMEAITDSIYCPIVFGVGHDKDGLWLDAHFGKPGTLFYPSERFVVARRKSRRSRAT